MLNDSNRNDFLFKDIKEYNKYLLVLIGVLIIVLTGIISYNFSNNSYAKWSSNSESKNTLKLSIKQKNMDSYSLIPFDKHHMEDALTLCFV